LLAEIGDDRERFEGDAQNLQCLAGTAPVNKRSGKHRECQQRWTCNKYVRHTVHLFSEQSLTRCAWAEIYYKARRANHGRSLPLPGTTLAYNHLQNVDGRIPYNPQLHHLNQVKHGSWVLTATNLHKIPLENQ
jgi:hypothetical protein